MSDPSPGLRPALPVIQVWQEPNQLWRWRYLEPSENGQPRAFRSNKDYESREAALRSATTAYPDVLVLEREAAGVGRARWGRTRNRLLLLLLVALVAVVVLVFWPRRRRAARGPAFESDRQGSVES
jgi:hypothetical protein